MRSKRFVLALLVVVAAGVAAAVAVHATSSPDRVPRVFGLTKTEAMKALERVGVRWRFSGHGFVFKHRRAGMTAGDNDLVIRQRPGSGTRITSSTVVTLTVCAVDSQTGCIDAHLTGRGID